MLNLFHHLYEGLDSRINSTSVLENFVSTYQGLRGNLNSACLPYFHPIRNEQGNQLCYVNVLMNFLEGAVDAITDNPYLENTLPIMATGAAAYVLYGRHVQREEQNARREEAPVIFAAQEEAEEEEDLDRLIGAFDDLRL